MITAEDLDNRFKYHPPGHAAKESHHDVRQLLLETAVKIVAWTPTCREQSLAVTHLEDAMMWANAAIARHTTE